MSSIWSSVAAQAGSSGSSPFATTGMSPTPGGGAAAKFQSILQSAGKQGPTGGQAVGQAGLSAKANSAAGAATPAGTSSGSSDSSGSDATITANDFLSLLVTEMQNQDPTADTDPNAYIDQLVQINSLEQLISINQNLSTVLGAASSPTSGSGTAAGVTPVGASPAAAKSGTQSGNQSGVASQAASVKSSSSAASAIQSAGAANRPATVRGNLSAPGDAPAAHKVAQALDGRSRAIPRGHAIRDIPTRPLP